MSHRTAHIKRVKNILSTYGFSIEKMRSRNHLVIHARHNNGTTAVFTAGVSPSDNRSIRNFEAFVRRTATAA